MAAQICESCKKKYENCYCSPNSTCDNYENEDKGGVGKFDGVPVNDDDIIAGFERLGYSRAEAEELAELCKLPITVCTDIDIDSASEALAKMIDKFCETGLPGDILTPDQVRDILGEPTEQSIYIKNERNNNDMKENLTEIVFIIDKSGSMFDTAKDTIGGFNSFVESQKTEPGEAILTTVLFDTNYETIHNGEDIKTVRPLTREDYRPIGMTALYDAVGYTIDEVGRRLYETPEDQRPSKVIFVITTDGLDNASHEYTQTQVKNMIAHQTEKYSWGFIFLGANIDAEEAATDLGISPSMSSGYTATSLGTAALYNTVTKAVSDYRCSGSIKSDWNADLVTNESILM